MVRRVLLLLLLLLLGGKGPCCYDWLWQAAYLTVAISHQELVPVRFDPIRPSYSAMAAFQDPSLLEDGDLTAIGYCLLLPSCRWLI